MNDKEPVGANYLKNTKTSKERTVRIEITGGVSEAEKNFLDGISFFVAGTMSKDNEAHTTYVAELMSRLIKHVITKLRKDKDKGSI